MRTDQTTAPGGGALSYDAENRLVSSAYGAENYAYHAGGRRIWKRIPNGTEELYFYGASGQKLGTFRPAVYTSPVSLLLQVVDLNLSFGSRTIAAIPERLLLYPVRNAFFYTRAP